MASNATGLAQVLRINRNNEIVPLRRYPDAWEIDLVREQAQETLGRPPTDAEFQMWITKMYFQNNEGEQ